MTMIPMPAKGVNGMANLNTQEIAAEFGISPKTLRKFLRSDSRERGIATPGKGQRYSIPRKELRGLKSRFEKWQIAQNAKNAETENTDSE